MMNWPDAISFVAVMGLLALLLYLVYKAGE